MSAAVAAKTPPPAKLHVKRDWPKHLIIWGFILIELFPLYMMFQVSFKDNASFIRQPWLPLPPSEWQWDNWLFAIKLIGPYLANTVFVAVTSTVATLFLAILAAYFFARHKLPFSGMIWSAFLILMLLPSVANIVPLFMLLKSMSLLNTLLALILVGVAAGQVFNIFVLRNFIEDLPKDLFEAAEMDGATHFQQVINVVIPMSGPIIGTLAILSFLSAWNEFLLPLIILRDKELFTLGVGLIYLDGEYVKPWGKIMAAYFLSAIPLIAIFLFTMRLFVRGLSAGAIKG
jgi:multiple sugar transport system permease protein